MALVCGLLGFLIYCRGLSRAPASLATLAELCFPASAALANWIFLDSESAKLQIAGVVLPWMAVLWKIGETRPPDSTSSQ